MFWPAGKPRLGGCCLCDIAARVRPLLRYLPSAIFSWRCAACTWVCSMLLTLNPNRSLPTGCRLRAYRSPKAALLVVQNPALLTASSQAMAASLDKAMDIISLPPRAMAQLLLRYRLQGDASDGLYVKRRHWRALHQAQAMGHMSDSPTYCCLTCFALRLVAFDLTCL